MSRTKLSNFLAELKISGTLGMMEQNLHPATKEVSNTESKAPF
jgi:hypothetical protein